MASAVQTCDHEQLEVTVASAVFGCDRDMAPPNFSRRSWRNRQLGNLAALSGASENGGQAPKVTQKVPVIGLPNSIAAGLARASLSDVEVATLGSGNVQVQPSTRYGSNRRQGSPRPAADLEFQTCSSCSNRRTPSDGSRDCAAQPFPVPCLHKPYLCCSRTLAAGAYAVRHVQWGRGA